MEQVTILDNRKKDLDEYTKLGWGSSSFEISKEQLDNFIDNGVIAIFDGEYTNFIFLKEE